MPFNRNSKFPFNWNSKFPFNWNSNFGIQLAGLKSEIQISSSSSKYSNCSSFYIHLQFCHLLYLSLLRFVNMCFIKRKYLSSSTSAERSFSRLKQRKSYTRSTMDETRLLDLSVLNIEKEFSENLD